MRAVTTKRPDVERDLAAGAPTRSRTSASRFSSYLAYACSGPEDTLDARALLTGCERFEQVVSPALAVLISFIVIITFPRLTYRVCILVVFDVIDPNQPEVFQTAFRHSHGGLELMRWLSA